MKKLDKLVLYSFIGPFVLTFFVTVFILLLVFMLKYFDDLVGKGIDFMVIMELIFYFSINTIPSALPLAVLLSSLMTFGKLGEHFELIAIKSAGISLLRILRPVFFFVVLITVLSYYNNNYIVPKANINAYSLLYDIKKKKPSMELIEGQFYNGLPGYSIKVNDKLPDGITLKDIIIFDHSDKSVTGNNRVITGDSSKMYTILNDRYMVLDLFNGTLSDELPARSERGKQRNFIHQLYRNEFDSMKIVFNLASFDLGNTKKELFAGNRIMKNTERLKSDADSMKIDSRVSTFKAFSSFNRNYDYNKYSYDRLPHEVKTANALRRRHILSRQEYCELEELDHYPLIFKLSSKDTTYHIELDSLNKMLETSVLCDSTDTITIETINPYGEYFSNMDSLFSSSDKLKNLYDRSLTKLRRVHSVVNSHHVSRKGLMAEIRRHDFQRYRKYAEALTCIIMFLIGAPLGAIIKRGGLGLPVLLSIVFFILFYIFNMTGDKWSKTGVMEGVYAAWIANFFLAPIGLFFLRQARIDARLFDADIYLIWFDKLKSWYLKKWKK